jgi:formamidopyrimidine-DNA glycosylase
MPELPEVETYVRELEPSLLGRSVIAVQVYWPRIIAAPSALDFVTRIVGQRFVRFGRRAKYMLLGLSSDTLIVHLRMTGRLNVVPAGTGPDKHTHIVMALDSGQDLHYQDTRKFGRLWLVDDPEFVLSKLSVEPLSADFTADRLAACLAQRSASIKALLLDQRIAAGVGNIYADEALFLAGIHPVRAGGSLSWEEAAKLRNAVQTVLQRGIEHNGSSLGDSILVNYRRADGKQGGFQEEFQVYSRQGKACLRCGERIEKMVVAQRGTHFCPRCQPRTMDNGHLDSDQMNSGQ